MIHVEANGETWQVNRYGVIMRANPKPDGGLELPGFDTYKIETLYGTPDERRAVEDALYAQGYRARYSSEGKHWFKSEVL